MQRDSGQAIESQRTLRAPAEVAGVGLFSGAPGRITIRPADAGSGIMFRRVDLAGSPVIPALVDHVVERPRRTALRAGEATVETVEHLLSALSGLGVDNALVDVEGPELPAGDGSAGLFVEAIRRAGLVEQGQPRRPLVITRPVVVRDGDATVMAVPTEAGLSEMMYVLDYGPGSPLGRQIHTYVVSPAVYAEQIAPARTFSTQAEAEAAHQRGLFKHLSPKEMLVIGPAGPIENSYRFDDEPVRHKVLDLVGDLSLVGRPIKGRIVAIRSGHALNHRMARELLEAAKREEEGVAGPVSVAEAATRALTPAMDVRQILRTLPHRYPMVLVDRVLELEPDRRAVGVKNVTINEPFFAGHYPGAPVMPGVLIVEAMCQLAGLMFSKKLNFEGKIAALMALDGVRLRRPVVPGDQLVMETEAVRSSTRYGEAHCRAYVGGDLAAEAKMKFIMIEPERLLTDGAGE